MTHQKNRHSALQIQQETLATEQKKNHRDQPKYSNSLEFMIGQPEHFLGYNQSTRGTSKNLYVGVQ